MPSDFDGSFADFLDRSPSGRFTDWLAARAEPYWSEATGHPFTVAIGNGAMPEAAYARYLIEDYTFVTDLASTLGYLVAKAPGMPAKSRLAGFLALLTSEENDYFLRSFEALGVEPQVYESAAQGPVTRAFSQLMLESSGQGSYAQGLACLLCAEWCYLTWGVREARKPRPDAFYLAEWIDLHAVPDFEAFVNWIRAEMDRIGPALTELEQANVADLFRRMSKLEAAFFETAWTGKLPGSEEDLQRI
ncbi:transcriptional regulator putative [Roseibium aggregatum IAM 12614]|uniref:Aminopyrimidine aminohydrolase n=1 Tax=Roseibium aggregatum (strain ATCC 25650 / DSM 13394 / JCM 20685 / NBRC 16684 / NCIMB 2208 / IAM 12614 / B1) TaxID=384765 RepID=A0NYX8_ROSAI|nr:TenA family protein [Roseibium aggregatum]EAV41979.1 transcriptional regulator putative [Roseibium aggregatum IAM 12614]